MAWYDTGTVAVTNGSTTVTGTGTDFISGAQVGEAFLAPDDKLYEIQSITSATVLVLADPYLGSTQSGQDYKIVPTQSLVADLASQVTDLITDYSDVKDTAGAGKFNDGTVTAPAITFEQDQNNGLYRIGNDNYAMSAGGVKQVDISSTDVELNYSGNKKLATTSTGVDVTGTVTADGLTVNTGSTFSVTGEFGGATNKIAMLNDDGGGRNQIDSTSTGSVAKKLDIATGGTKRLRIEDNGDFHLYEDTGTTAKFVWDSSAESLGIGGSPSYPLHITSTLGYPLLIERTNASDAGIRFKDSNTTDADSVRIGADGNDFKVLTNNSEAMRIDSSGNVGIGTSNLDAHKFRVVDATNASASFRTTDGTDRWIDIDVTSTGTNTIGSGSNHALAFKTNDTERARIDSSGNLLVGKSTTNTSVAGHRFSPLGKIQSTLSSDTHSLNRLSSDGSILTFQKDGAPVGSIGTKTGTNRYLTIGCPTGTPTGLIFDTATASIGAWNVSTNSGAGDTIDLGYASRRFKDLYLSGGVYLGGTGSANKLDDYEEGTYVATVTCTGSGSITANTGSDRLAYTKVGRKVTVTGIFTALSVSSPTGALQVTLPFASANLEDLSEFSRTMSYAYCSGTGAPSGTGYYPATYSGAGASSVLTVYFWQQNGGMDTSSADWFGAGSELYFMYTYFTT